jgi:6-phosphogluconolactonase
MTQLFSYNERADIAIAPNGDQAVDFAVTNFIEIGTKAIHERGAFHVALSGGSTPRAIFAKLTSNQLDWSKVHVYWGDERAVSPDDPQSNYKMAIDAAFNRLPVPKNQIFRMEAEDEINENAVRYQEILKQNLPEGKFDLVMLGMGDDGHTASLFPGTHALTDKREWVAANYVPQKNCWRMTLTYPCINHARSIVIYVIGKDKAKMLEIVLDGPYSPLDFPIQGVGSPSHKPLWVLDAAAASALDINGRNGNG